MNTTCSSTITNLASPKKETMNVNTNSNLCINTRSIWSTIYFILLAGFIYIQYVWYFTPNFEKLLFMELKDFTKYDIGLIWIPILLYVLVATEVCLLVQIIKPLKKYSEHGLIYMFCYSLKVSLILGLILSMNNFLSVLFMGLNIGLLGGLLGGMFVGLEYEFKKIVQKS